MASFPTRPGQPFSGDVADRLRAIDTQRFGDCERFRRLADCAANDPDLRVGLAYRLGAARGLAASGDTLSVSSWFRGIAPILEKHFGENPKPPEAA